MKRLTIVQYNCGHSNYRSTRPLFDCLDPEEYQIIALQEPAYNKQTRKTYQPKGYYLLYEPNPATRTCFLVSQHIDTQAWSYHNISPNIDKLQLATDRGQISIINVYNPSDNKPQIATWELLRQAIDTAEGEVIVLGDFNTHHTAWGGQQATVEAQATHLLNELETRGLALTTPTGEPTWKRGTQESTIDLTFIQETLADRLEFCGPEDTWAITADHIPIRIALNVATPAQRTRQRYATNKLNQEKYTQEITNRLAAIP
jgi:exonuclease III